MSSTAKLEVVPGAVPHPDARTRRWPKLALCAGWAGLLVGGLLAFQPGCASTRPATRQEAPVHRVWPDPPAPPRVAYVRSIREPVDLGVRNRGAKRLFQWLAGSDKSQDLAKPFGLALDENDNLCLTDTANAAVCYFDQSRKNWQCWNKIGKTPLVTPVAVAKRGNTFFVADSGLQKVLAFDTHGKALFELNQPMERPAGLAIGADRLFVADAAAHRILIFDLAGSYLSSFGARGTGPGEFNYPTHLAVDGQGRLFVTDSMNFRIQVFDSRLQPLNSVGSLGNTSGHLSRPKGVAVDGDGNLYVVDALFGNIQIFDQQGRLLLHVGTEGTGAGEFWLPAGIAIGQDNSIYVADSYNGRVQVLKYLSQP